MLCGGCAAKVGESSLTRALERLGVSSDPAVVLGLAQPDDAAAVETERGEIVAATVDSFRAFADDPYLVGRVAAVNAISDLWAKGVAPRFALAQVSVPEGEPERAGGGALPGDGRARAPASMRTASPWWAVIPPPGPSWWSASRSGAWRPRPMR